MSTSPTKRRRLNSSSAIPVSASNANSAPTLQPARQQPVDRASFLSPTKASLARSRPDVLPRAAHHAVAGRAQTAAFHAQRKELDRYTSRTTANEPPLLHLRSRTLPTTFLPYRRRPGERDQPLAQASPTDRSHDIDPGPHKQEQDEESAQSERDDLGSRSSSPSDNSGEPELPPTPTQLGLEKAPVRPKGVLSSSPSWRREMRRIRRKKMRNGLGSSPLKSKSAYFAETVERDNDIAHEYAPSGPMFSSEVQAKRKLRDSLASQLDRLKGEVLALEHEVRRLERPQDYWPSEDYLKNLTSLLTTTNPSCALSPSHPSTPPPISSMLSFLLPFSVPRYIPKPEREPFISPFPRNPFAPDEHSDLIPYLTLFAPLNLAVHTTTSFPSNRSSMGTSSSVVQRHGLTLSSPSDSRHPIYKVPLVVYTDPERRTIISISVDDRAATFGSQAPLRVWMESRLSNSLLKSDVPGLCWGICRYWEAIVSRAKVWVHFENMLSGMRSDPHLSPLSTTPEPAVSKEETPRKVSPHLDRNTFLFSFPDRPQLPQLLVTCSLTLDLWTGEPEWHPGISVISSPVGGDKVEGEAKALFWGFLKRHGEVDAEGFTSAVKAVVTAVLDMK